MTNQNADKFFESLVFRRFWKVLQNINVTIKTVKLRFIIMRSAVQARLSVLRRLMSVKACKSFLFLAFG
jgi:hypothetical protein